MRQNQCDTGPHTIQTHGATVAWTYLYDWLNLMLVGLLLITIHLVHPFYRFVGRNMMIDLKYPLKENTVPFWAVPIIAVGLPTAIFIAIYFRKRDVCDLHHAILGLLYSALVTSVITNAIKNAVGRPRPDFFWRCFPDGKDVYDRFGNVICHGEDNVVHEGYRSFPSGHTSGLVVAVFCYLHFFPPPYHSAGWFPHTCSRVSEMSVTCAGNAPNDRERTDEQIGRQENGSNGNVNGCAELESGGM